MWWTLAWIVPLQAFIFLALGLYRGLWRFASLVDLQRIVLAAGALCAGFQKPPAAATHGSIR